MHLVPMYIEYLGWLAACFVHGRTQRPGGRMKKVATPGRLKLNKTTLRKLTDTDLAEVAGGRISNECTAVGPYCSGTCTCTGTCITWSGCIGGAV